jgi:topoisomerase-4 subunit A
VAGASDRRSGAAGRAPVAKIVDRVELLEGYLIAYLNLDRVIQIIREEDEPKPVMMAEFGLTDRQAEAILNMRLASLRKLEEMQIRRERDALRRSARSLQADRVPGPAATKLKKGLTALRTRYGQDTELGARRTLIEEAGPRAKSRWRR